MLVHTLNVLPPVTTMTLNMQGDVRYLLPEAPRRAIRASPLSGQQQQQQQVLGGGGSGAAVFWLSSGQQPGPAGGGASLPAHAPALQLAPASEPAMTTAIKLMLSTNAHSGASTDTRWQMCICIYTCKCIA